MWEVKGGIRITQVGNGLHTGGYAHECRSKYDPFQHYTLSWSYREPRGRRRAEPVAGRQLKAATASQIGLRDHRSKLADRGSWSES